MSKIEVVKKHKTQSKEHFWLNKFIEFCRRTDLHGYKYIVMEDFNKRERCCWMLAVLISTAVAAYFVICAYKWYARNPVVTVIESTQGTIWDVPFPAVTICDLNIVSKKAARELANKLNMPANMTADYVFKIFRLIPLLHSTFKANVEEKDQLKELQVVLDWNNITISSLLKSLSPASSCSQLVKTCMWKNSLYQCDELFTQVFTLLSVCCTFNYYAVDEKKGIDGSPPLPTPRHVASCGYQTALTALLYSNTDDYYSASVASQGILVIIDSAYNIPDVDSPVRIVVPSSEVLIAVSPEKTYAVAGIKDFTPDDRQCYYSDEIRLGHLRQYSFHNCMVYQKVEILKRACGCVPYFIPLEVDYRICNFIDIDCIQSAFLNEDYITLNSSGGKTKRYKCLPDCEHYDYPLEVALSKLADNAYVNGLPFDNVTVTKHSILNVFFNDLVSTRYRRDVYLNWQNIFSAFGGLLSLMLGFTLISGFDLALFLTVKIAYTLCKSVFDNRNRNKIHVQKFREKGVSHSNSLKIDQINGTSYYDYGKY